MKLLKRQKGLPFLLALGILLLLSASFLAVQFWSGDNQRRGAVEALEAPVMPPTAPKIVAPPPVVPAAPEAVAIIPAEPLPVKEPELVVETKVVEPAPAIAPKAEIAVVVEAQPAQPVQISQPVQKKAKKSRKKVVKVEEIPTEIPPEWNWFSKPLKLNLSQGKAEIVVSEGNQEIILAAAPVEPVVAVVLPDSSESPAKAFAETEKPFVTALARMAKLRQMREAYAARRSAPAPVKPVAVVESVSPSMRRMGELLRLLSEKLNRRSVPAVVATEEVKAVAETSEIAPATAVPDVASEETIVELAPTSVDAVELKPYRGSGSSFSSRVNEMIKRGAWLKE